jgi:hypothetical protein
MTTAVDKGPAAAQPLGSRAGKPLTYSSYTTPWDRTLVAAAELFAAAVRFQNGDMG